MAYGERGRGKHSKVYRGRWRDAERNIQTVSDAMGETRWFRTKREAVQAAQAEEVDYRNGTWFDPRKGEITFSDYFEKKWKPAKVVELNTTRKYDDQYESKNWGLKGYWGNVELRQIHSTSVQIWVAKMKKAGLAPTLIEARFKAFQTVLAGGTIGTRRRGTSALKQGLIRDNPCIGIELPHVPKPEKQIYTPDQVVLVIQEMDAWYRPIPLFLSDTAIRWGELLGLQVDDFMLGFRSFMVRRTIIEPGSKYTENGTPFLVKPYPKGKKPRQVSLTKDAATCVQQMIAERGLGPGDRIFTAQAGVGHGKKKEGDGVPLRTEAFPEGHPIGKANFRNRVWKPAIERAGVPYRKVHQLRSSGISWLLAANLPLTDVMELVGHEQFATTQLYATTMPDDKYDAVNDAMDNIKARFGAGGMRRAQ